MKNVQHVPNMHLNLLSTHAFDKGGYDSYLGSERWKLIKGSMVFSIGNVCCTLYKTRVKVCSEAVNATESDSSPDL